MFGKTTAKPEAASNRYWTGSSPKRIALTWPLGALLGALLVPAVSFAQAKLKIGDREEVLSGPADQIAPRDIEKYIEAPLASTGLAAGVSLFEGRAYRALSVEWEKGTTVTIQLFGRMKEEVNGKTEFVVKNCGRLTAAETSWTLGPDDLVCNGNYIDKSALIEFRFEDGSGSARFAYVRIFNRRFPVAGSDAGIVLTLTERLKAGDDSDDGFTATNGISVYYAVSRLKSQRFRGIVHVSALDQLKDEKDLEVGLGAGFLFKSNGFMDTNTGLSLAGGIGYNLMIPKSNERWYWFVGLGTNFDLGKKD
ncbi:MAG: hypothetical protein KBI44_13605 [Thermoanaerobaculia bacterium]|nr:hypothetical protein [Thermoanaerobaculia bacterium]